LPFVLASCTSAQLPAAQFVDAAQPQWAATLPLDQSLGQTFLVNHAGLQAVEVYLAFQQPYTGTLTLHLLTDPQACVDIATAQLGNGRLSTPGFYRFSFPGLPPSDRKNYYAFLDSEPTHRVLVGTES